VERDTNSHNPEITLTLEGGDGLGLVKEAALFVVRSDGSLAEGRAEFPKKGSTITLVGTPTKDRVIIWITLNTGTAYKIYDQEVPFIQRG
jgi:hypothetical protein